MKTLFKNELRNLNGGAKLPILIKPTPFSPTIDGSSIEDGRGINVANGAHVSVTGSSSGVSGLEDAHGGTYHGPPQG